MNISARAGETWFGTEWQNSLWTDAIRHETRLCIIRNQPDQLDRRKAELRAGPTVSVGSANREGFRDSTRSTGLTVFFPFIKYLCWGLITQSLMRSLQVVEVKVSPNAGPGFFTPSICFPIHPLVLQTPPQPLHE